LPAGIAIGEDREMLGGCAQRAAFDLEARIGCNSVVAIGPIARRA
jgi:hypothetical protein